MAKKQENNGKPRVITLENEMPQKIKQRQFTYTCNMIIQMKKKHPCGSDSWRVLRIGTDMKLQCQGCGHEMMMPRPLVEKSTKRILEEN